ncbi:MAG: hypothetical protein AAFS10_18870 [Myxococcota bacterium]
MAKKKKTKSPPPPQAATGESSTAAQSPEAVDHVDEAQVDSEQIFRTRLGLVDANLGKAGMDVLEAAYGTFTRGDYPTTRARLHALIDDDSASQEAREGARLLLEAIDLDRSSLIIAAVCVVLFAVILFLVY